MTDKWQKMLEDLGIWANDLEEELPGGLLDTEPREETDEPDLGYLDPLYLSQKRNLEPIHIKKLIHKWNDVQKQLDQSKEHILRIHDKGSKRMNSVAEENEFQKQINEIFKR